MLAKTGECKDRKKESQDLVRGFSGVWLQFDQGSTLPAGVKYFGNIAEWNLMGKRA